MLAELIHITKHYNPALAERQKPVLDGLYFSLEASGSVAIKGPSGSGKTTFLNILGTLDRPDSGQVRLGGKDVAGLGDRELSRLRSSFIGFVFQMHHLLPQLSLFENVTLPLLAPDAVGNRKEGLERARYLVSRMDLAGLEYRRPAELSAGECQRAAIARALVNSPSLLLADEPTGSLDSENAEKTGELLSCLQKEENLAMVIVTHSRELAARMDKIYSLTSGKLLPAE